MGKEKRTIWFGMPVYVVRKQLIPFFVVQIAIMIFFAGTWLNDPENFADFLKDSPQSALILVVLPALVPFVSLISFYKKQKRYMKRFTSLGGRVCFACDYEIADELGVCSECGARWSLDDLNASWKKALKKT